MALQQPVACGRSNLVLRAMSCGHWSYFTGQISWFYLTTSAWQQITLLQPMFALCRGCIGFYCTSLCVGYGLLAPYQEVIHAGRVFHFLLQVTHKLPEPKLVFPENNHINQSQFKSHILHIFQAVTHAGGCLLLFPILVACPGWRFFPRSSHVTWIEPWEELL